MKTNNISNERRAHAPRLAGAEVAHRVEVVVTGNHRKEPASWGCHDAACSEETLNVDLTVNAEIKSLSLLPNRIDLASQFFSSISKMAVIYNSDAPVVFNGARNPDARLGIKSPYFPMSPTPRVLSSYHDFQTPKTRIWISSFLFSER